MEVGSGGAAGFFLPDRVQAFVEVEKLVVERDQNVAVLEGVHLVVGGLEDELAGDVDEAPFASSLDGAKRFGELACFFPYGG